MTFIKRKIDIRMALNGDTFDGSNNTINLTGLRCHATIQSFIGSTGVYANTMSLRINGMKNADMAKFSTLGFSTGTYTKNLIDVYAGDDVYGMNLAFSGAITYGDINYNAQPDVGVDLVCSALANLQYAPIAASSYKGVMDVASMLQAICAASNPPLAFINNGVTAVLSNHAVGGTAKAQIEDICTAAGISYAVTNGTLFIWPLDGTKDAVLIEMDSSKGLVGYPRYNFRGLSLTSVFNPHIEVGRQMKVASSTPAPAANAPQQVPGQLAGHGPLQISGANGTFATIAATHDLASETPDGPWFTHVELASNAFNAR